MRLPQRRPNRKHHPFPEFEPHFLACRQTLQSLPPPLLASVPGKRKNSVGGEERPHPLFIKRKLYGTRSRKFPEPCLMSTRAMPCDEHSEGNFFYTRKFVLIGNRTSDLSSRGANGLGSPLGRPTLGSVPGKRARATEKIIFIIRITLHEPDRLVPAASRRDPYTYAADGGACPSSKSSSSQEAHCVHWSEPQSLLLLPSNQSLGA